MLRSIRAAVYVGSIVWFLCIVTYIALTIPPSPSRYIHLSRTFADTAGILLYITLLIGPLSYHFRASQWAAVAIKARQAVGLSVLFFSLLHSGTAFLFQLGGVAGLSYLSTRYLLAFALGFDALLLLVLLAVTSPEKITQWLGGRLWKVVHRMVYLIGILIFFHILLLGSRFVDLHSTVAVLSFVVVSVLWLLECRRIDVWLSGLLPKYWRLPIALFVGSLLVATTAIFMVQNKINPYSLSGHDGHYEFENRVGMDGVHHEEN